MRYYVVNQDTEYKKEIHIDLYSFKKINEYSYVCDFETPYNNQSGKVYIRKLAHKFFVSFDGVKWKKLASLNLIKDFLNVNHFYELFRGYKPVGVGSTELGALKTSMPGKVIKVNFKEGDTVQKGATLLILEAMKMENEIKSNLDGKIKAIHVKEGENIEQGKLMIEIE
ncbi:MAG: acetyl-CoA carboxylase biotin carboxyl carrier protein subunit [Bacteriovoracaceae bacterium]